MGYFLVYTPTNTWKAPIQFSTVRILEGLLTGSKRRACVKFLELLESVNWYFPSFIGLERRIPKSMNSLFKIFARILSETRASTGRLGEVKTVDGSSGASPDKIDCIACTDEVTSAAESLALAVDGTTGDTTAGTGGGTAGCSTGDITGGSRDAIRSRTRSTIDSTISSVAEFWFPTGL